MTQLLGSIIAILFVANTVPFSVVSSSVQPQPHALVAAAALSTKCPPNGHTLDIAEVDGKLQMKDSDGGAAVRTKPGKVIMHLNNGKSVTRECDTSLLRTAVDLTKDVADEDMSQLDVAQRIASNVMTTPITQSPPLTGQDATGALGGAGAGGIGAGLSAPKATDANDVITGVAGQKLSPSLTGETAVGDLQPLKTKERTSAIQDIDAYLKQKVDESVAWATDFKERVGTFSPQWSGDVTGSIGANPSSGDAADLSHKNGGTNSTFSPAVDSLTRQVFDVSHAQIQAQIDQLQNKMDVFSANALAEGYQPEQMMSWPGMQQKMDELRGRLVSVDALSAAYGDGLVSPALAEAQAAAARGTGVLPSVFGTNAEFGAKVMGNLQAWEPTVDSLGSFGKYLSNRLAYYSADAWTVFNGSADYISSKSLAELGFAGTPSQILQDAVDPAGMPDRLAGSTATLATFIVAPGVTSRIAGVIDGIGAEAASGVIARDVVIAGEARVAAPLTESVASGAADAATLADAAAAERINAMASQVRAASGQAAPVAEVSAPSSAPGSLNSIEDRILAIRRAVQGDAGQTPNPITSIPPPERIPPFADTDVSVYPAPTRLPHIEGQPIDAVPGVGARGPGGTAPGEPFVISPGTGGTPAPAVSSVLADKVGDFPLESDLTKQVLQWGGVATLGGVLACDTYPTLCSSFSFEPPPAPLSADLGTAVPVDTIPAAEFDQIMKQYQPPPVEPPVQFQESQASAQAGSQENTVPAEPPSNEDTGSIKGTSPLAPPPDDFAKKIEDISKLSQSEPDFYKALEKDTAELHAQIEPAPASQGSTEEEEKAAKLADIKKIEDEMQQAREKLQQLLEQLPPKIVEKLDIPPAAFEGPGTTGPLSQDQIQHALTPGSQSTTGGAQKVDLEVNFQSGLAALRPDGLAQVNDLGAVLSKNEFKGSSFVIDGYTDTIGTPQGNLSLSLARAQAVAHILTSQYGISPEQITIHGYGDTQLKVPVQGDQPQNRRVVVTVVPHK